MFPKKFKSIDITFEKLSEDSNLSDFCCDFEDELGVNDFIHNEAWLYHTGNFGVTYLYYYKDVLIGFVTIAMGNIDAKKEAPDKEEIDEEITIKQYPSLLIGQIGVHNDCRGRGLGKIICDWCAGKAAELQDIIGCRYVSVTTIKKWIGFYEKCDFKTTNLGKKYIIMVRKV